MKFRLVYFTPDPFRGDRFVVGAMVGDHREARFERTHHVPGPECLGGRNLWIALQLALDSLTSNAGLSVEPGVASQLISLGEIAEAPSTEDATNWVRSTFFAQLRDPAERRHVAPYHEQRGAYGTRFFERWKVNRYVKHHFNLGDFVHIQGGLPQLPRKPTHWVKGRNRLLLMEPIVGTRASLHEDLKAVGASMLAHMKLLELAKSETRPEMIVYVFSNGYHGAMSETRASLDQIVKVVDVEKPKERDEFLEQIRLVGRTEATLFPERLD